MAYHQITPAERYMLAQLRKQQPMPSIRQIAALMERHPSSISREIRRNRSRLDGMYRSFRAQENTNGRRRRSRRNSHFSTRDWKLIERLLKEDLSPE